MMVAILSLIASLFFALTSMASECRFELRPRVLESEKSHLLQYWEFRDASILNSEVLPRSAAFRYYRNAIQARLDTDPISLLKRYLLIGPNNDDAYNLKLVQSHSVGRIRPIRCIEALLLDYQLRRNSKMLYEPTEFLSFFLRNADGRVRVYYLTSDINGVRKMGSLIARASFDLKAGWVLVANLHNHSFFLNHLEPGDRFHPQGVLAPSASDVQAFLNQQKDLKLQQALITNGFHTLEVDSRDFTRLHGTDNGIKP